MRKTLALISLMCALAAVSAAANLVITPTTTLSAETGNNTSASSSFPTSNGNAAAANVSKVDVHSLMYPGYTGPVFAHLVGWFGASNHMNVGYTSYDPAQVHKQITDMISRGINGLIQVWYGGGTETSNKTATAVKNEAELHPGFTFMLMIDHGAIAWNSCYTSGCTATQAVTQLTTYIANNYFSSPAYLRINGRPVITNFDIDLHYTVDWNYVAANTPGNPIFWFQNSGGFSHVQSAGAYSWVMPATTDYGMSYLTSFYNKGMTYPAESTVGAAYKGFNDTLAAWGANRIMGQQCGQTWLQTFAKANSLYSPSNPLSLMQLVTWNDYEEGSEIESGIDNCAGISASLSGTLLNWTLTGSATTIDHYTIFISTDGQNLMSLGDWPVDTNQLDLTSFALDPGTYQVFVKAVGKPVFRNQMTAAVTYTVSDQPPTAALSLTPASGPSPLMVTASTSASTDPDGTTGLTSSVDWGDGSAASAGPTATHSYTQAGVFTVRATVTDKGGLSSATTATVNVADQPPTAALTLSATTVNVAQTVNASTSGSSDADGTVTSTSINWGDGSSSMGPSASHAYAKPGSYIVTATATDNLGASGQATASLTVNDLPPVAALSLSTTSGLAPVSVTASTANSTSAYSTLASSSINWGDGSSSAGPTAAHSYPTPGSYTVTATVTDSFGLSSTATQLVTVQSPYVAISSPANGATVSSPVQLSAQAFDGRKIASMIVYVDNVRVYTIYAASLSTAIPMSPGVHTIQVKAWEDVTGVVYQAAENVTVSAQAPTATLSLSATSGVAPVAISAAVSGTDPNLNGSISAVSVNWGDGTITSGSSATHTYAAAGTYSVVATVTDNYGASGTTFQAVTVQAPYVAITSPLSGSTMGSPVHLTAQAFDGRPIASMIVYVDGANTYTVFASSLDTYIKMSPGTHGIVVKAWENVTGNILQSSTTVNVPQPAVGVNIQSPSNGATVGSPVHFVASASGNRPIASMIIYVDNVNRYLVYASSLDTYLAIASGQHTVIIKAWDNGGAIYQSSVGITVP